GTHEHRDFKPLAPAFAAPCSWVPVGVYPRADLRSDPGASRNRDDIGGVASHPEQTFRTSAQGKRSSAGAVIGSGGLNHRLRRSRSSEWNSASHAGLPGPSWRKPQRLACESRSPMVQAKNEARRAFLFGLREDGSPTCHPMVAIEREGQA